jgi:hypothetical protein
MTSATQKKALLQSILLFIFTPDFPTLVSPYQSLSNPTLGEIPRQQNHTLLPHVISTEAQRSGETSVFHV